MFQDFAGIERRRDAICPLLETYFIYLQNKGSWLWLNLYFHWLKITNYKLSGWITEKMVYQSYEKSSRIDIAAIGWQY